MSDPTTTQDNLEHYSCQMSCVVVGSDINMDNLTHYSCQMSCVVVGSGINMDNLTHYSCQMSCVVVGSDINMDNLTHYSCQMSCVLVGSGISMVSEKIWWQTLIDNKEARMLENLKMQTYFHQYNHLRLHHWYLKTTSHEVNLIGSRKILMERLVHPCLWYVLP
jgi:hypothetical protein